LLEKLAENWNTYKDNYVNNPIAADRLCYDVLFHTDLSRDHGTSNWLNPARKYMSDSGTAHRPFPSSFNYADI
jgi:hypothetical protein